MKFEFLVYVFLLIMRVFLIGVRALFANNFLYFAVLISLPLELRIIRYSNKMRQKIDWRKKSDNPCRSKKKLDDA